MSAMAADLREEGRVLYELLKAQPAALWDVKTRFKDWTVWDVIAHLHFSDHMAVTTARSEADFATLSGELMGYFQKGLGLQDYAREWLGKIDGPELLERWYGAFTEMCDLFDGYPADARLKWFGPDMGVRMFATARQMETWAHGQALYDMLGLERVNTDRIKNIVVIGVKTFGFAYKNRSLPVPDTMPYITLSAPSGESWTFGEAGAASKVTGSAVEFAQVATQTRNVDDTNLVIEGEVAHSWMKIVQCFAGSPEQPPASGERFKAKTSIV